MKIILNLIMGFGLLLLFGSGVNSQEAQNIQFIYINGSNSNDEAAKDAYVKGFNTLHREMKKEFESNDFILTHLLNNHKYTINPNADILFWGFSSRQELDVIKDNLEEAKKNSPVVAQTIRSILAHCMHDAIWVQKENNMQKVINQLHKNVTDAYSKGEKVVLLGHSAGSFVTVEYMRHKLKGVDLSLFTGIYEDKYTCADAIIASGMGYKLANERLKKNPNEKQFMEAYKNIDRYTESVCTPDDVLVGVINFGSPFSLFYSNQISHSKDISSAYQLYFLKYIQEKDIFLLTVNFADDPVGFPVSRNISKSDIEMEFNTTLKPDGRGFIYNYSKTRSTGMFATAHFAYWKHAKRFARTVRDAYIKGYNNFYSIYSD